MTVEDKFHMKKFGPLIALTLLAGCVTFCALSTPVKGNAKPEE